MLFGIDKGARWREKNHKHLIKTRKRLHHDYNNFVDNKLQQIPDEGLRGDTKKGLSHALPIHIQDEFRPHKKQKSRSSTLHFSETKESMPFRSRQRRPILRRRRIVRRRVMKRRRMRRSRRPSSRRTGSNRLVAMIKKVAIGAMEPKRHPILITAQRIPDNTIVTVPLTRLVQQQTMTSLNDHTRNFSGKSAYFKGVRVKGYIRNASQLPARVHMWVVQNKIKDGLNIGDALSVQGATIWHDPVTGTEVTYAAIPKLFQQSPSLHRGAPVRVKRKFQMELKSNMRGEGAAALGEVNLYGDGGEYEFQPFDFYIPINQQWQKKVTENAPGVPTIFQREIGLWFFAEPYAQDLEFVVNAEPLVTLTAVTYFRD